MDLIGSVFRDYERLFRCSGGGVEETTVSQKVFCAAPSPPFSKHNVREVQRGNDKERSFLRYSYFSSPTIMFASYNGADLNFDYLPPKSTMRNSSIATLSLIFALRL